MYWEDRGYLLSKNKYSENSSIVELYTENHGKVLGIIYGATSKKIAEQNAAKKLLDNIT